ncbi:MAG: biopolymer transporter ExbD [Nitratiruptor sp.]|nr:biopolymer transporter ExbD [Nitratiruptor sp.]NPA83998.1 biopolymer transporter ExbD [Campylobacterota bacterium]
MFPWDEQPELNITPLVDVMLVLLAILMVATPAIVYEEEINLPQGSRTKAYAKRSQLHIRVDGKRQIFVGKERFSWERFADGFLLLSQKVPKDAPVYISADKHLPYQDVIYILKTVKEAGFTKVSLLTDG